MTQLRASIIIPTYNRPVELRNCIRSILDQTVRPYEVIVIEDGEATDFPLETECRALGIRCVYHKKDIPGLTASRNAGVRLAGGEIVFFLDDDVVLFPDYVEEMLSIYQTSDHDGMLGGVGGLIDNTRPLKLDNYLFYPIKVLFLTSGIREGRVLPSGFCTDFGTTPFVLKQPVPVDFLSGGVSSFKKEVFEHFSFSDNYRGYGLGEDKDFTFRVSKKYRLMVNPRARLLHHESPKMRYDKRRMGRAFVLYTDCFFRDFLKRGWWSRLVFYYALLGYLLERVLIMISSPGKGEAARVKGILSAIKDVTAGKTSA